MSVNKPKPATTSKTGTPAAKPQGGTPPENGAGPDKCTVIFKEKGWTMATYENSTDGSDGFILSNGQTAFHFDSNGNMILATGKPLGGCGGKAIIIANESQQKYRSYALEVTGNDDQTEETLNSEGNTETVKVPAYSICVYGDVAIEAVGGDIGLKGDNITLNAASTLTLKSGENILLQSGEGGGNFDITAGNVNLEAVNFKKAISGGEYSEGAGEFKVEQNKKGAVTELSTPGSLNYLVNGNYTLGVKGDFAINTEGSFALSSKKNYFVTALGNADEKIDGKKKISVTGGSTIPIDQQEAFLIETGASGKTSFKLDSNADVDIESKVGGMNVKTKTNINVEATGLVKIKGSQIFLN